VRSFQRTPAGRRTSFTSLQTIVESLEAAHAGSKVGSMKNLDRADGVVEVRMKGSAKEGADLTAFWDRHSGGEMTNAAPAAARILSVLVDFHKNLAMGKEGRAVNGIVAIGFVWVVFTGFIAWWPGLANWKRGFTLNWKLSWKRINYDLHNSVGIVSVGFLILMAVTAVCLAAKDIPRLMTFGKGPSQGGAEKIHGGNGKHRRGGGKSEGRAQAGGNSIDDLAAIASADAALASFRLHALELGDKHGGGVELEYSGAPGTVIVRLDSTSGAILSRTAPSRLGVDLEAHDWIQALHFGRWGGLATRITWVFLGLAPGILALTGLLMWWNRSLSKKLA